MVDDDPKATRLDFLTQYRLGQKEGYLAASNTGLWEDVKTIGASILGLPGYVWDTLGSDEIGPVDDKRMSAYYQALLEIQHRGYEAGYLSEFDWATQQRLMVEGMALGAATGPVLGGVVRVGGKLYSKIGNKLVPIAETAESAPPVSNPNFQILGGPSKPLSPTITADTTVYLTRDVPLANGKVIPAGSTVIVDAGMDTMKVVLPDGTGYMARYSTSVQKALPAPAGQGTNKVFEFSAVENPGPLAWEKDPPAANFFGGKYNEVVLQEDLVLYRGGQAGKELGQWFTRDAPDSLAQIRIDSAVKPQWISPVTGKLESNSPIDTVYAIKIPKGTTVYEGPVGYQGGVYLGGPYTNQVFVPKPWNIPGVEILNTTPIK
jgi:hypothetical protein